MLARLLPVVPSSSASYFLVAASLVLFLPYLLFMLVGPAAHIEIDAHVTANDSHGIALRMYSGYLIPTDKMSVPR